MAQTAPVGKPVANATAKVDAPGRQVEPEHPPVADGPCGDDRATECPYVPAEGLPELHKPRTLQDGVCGRAHGCVVVQLDEAPIAAPADGADLTPPRPAPCDVASGSRNRCPAASQDACVEGQAFFDASVAQV
jgi:hypothetical protein